MSQAGSFGTAGVIPPGTYTETLTGNTGGVVSPDSVNSNINIVGVGLISVAGNPGTHTLDLALSGAVADEYVTNAGTAIPSLGVLNILGSGSASTSASGNTITITASGGGGGAGTITGNDGTPEAQVGGNWDILTAGATVLFEGSAGTETLNFDISNLLLGDAAASVTSAVRNAGLGGGVLNGITSATDCVAVGYEAGFLVTDANESTFVGSLAGSTIVSGVNNIALGYAAGTDWHATSDNNINIGTVGANESSTIRIGTHGTHLATFIAGIDTVDVGDVATVVTEYADQLGTAVLTAGAGITITPTANVITIAADTTAGTITGNDGTPEAQVGGNWDIVTANATPIFAGSSGTETLDFGLTNLTLGSSMSALTSGTRNVGLGLSALSALTSAVSVVAVGYHAGVAVTSGGTSTFVGSSTAGSITTGTNLIALGYNSGSSWAAANSGNIAIGNVGANESNTIRIGTNGTQTATYIVGIDGVNVGSVATVVTEHSDQLGTAVITGGTGITVTPTANTITISVSGSAVAETITGNTGGALSPTAGNWNIVTSNATVGFAGAVSTETLNFGISNLVLGSSLPSLTSGTNNTGLGDGVLSGVTSGSNLTALGFHAGNAFSNETYNITIGAGNTGRQAESGMVHIATYGAESQNYNTFVGDNAGNLTYTVGTATNNTFIGAYSGNSTTSASANTLIGGAAGTRITSGSNNCALGQNALAASFSAGLTTGSNNTAIGRSTLYACNGSNNTALGYQAAAAYTGAETYNINIGSGSVGVAGESGCISIGIPGYTQYSNTNIFIGNPSGNTTYTVGVSLDNVAIGGSTMNALTTGQLNTAVGNYCLASLTTGINNFAGGNSCLDLLTTGTNNTAIGSFSLSKMTTGNYSTAIGYSAGSSNTSGSSNIYINNVGGAGDNNYLRIGGGTGTGNQQINTCVISGIRGRTISGGATVLSGGGDTLGTINSSIRFKENVQDMGDLSSDIMKLRPVGFTWKEHPDHGQQTGLIAEEVLEVMPHLVVYGDDGQVMSVMYHEFPALLLNELQKLAKEVKELRALIQGGNHEQ